MEQEIRINENEVQTVIINSVTPQTINIQRQEQQDLNINQQTQQNINIQEKDNQLIYIEDFGKVINITDVLVNGVSVVSNHIAYIIVPTKLSQLLNDSGYLTKEQDPTIPNYIKQISLEDITNWNNKQNLLVSGTNIKTINNSSIVGSGNLEIAEYEAGTGINITGHTINNTIINYDDLNNKPVIPTKVSELENDSNYVTIEELSEVAFSGDYDDLTNKPFIPTETNDLLNNSGFIDKNVNDLTYYTLTSNLSTVAISGDYDDLINKPSIPSVNDGTLTIQQNGTNIETFTANSSTNKTANITVPTKTSDLQNDSNFLVNSDSGWIDLTLLNGVTARDNSMTYKPQIRKINNVVYMKGQVNIPTTSDIIMCVIPDGYRPSFEAKMGNVNTNNWIDTSGNVNLSATNQLYFQSINTFWLVN